MDGFVMPLMLALDASSLTMSLVNVASPDGHATALADSVETALRTLAHLDVQRFGDTVIARTEAGHAERVLVAARLTTAATVTTGPDPLAYVEMGKLFGPGASGAKGALAVTLRAAATGGYARDVTFVLDSGAPTVEDELLRCDVALIAEPTNAAVRGDALDEPSHPSVQRLIALTGTAPVVGGAHGAGRFARLGVPVVAFGPGDPTVAGTPGEFVPTAELTQCEFVLRTWLTDAP